MSDVAAYEAKTHFSEILDRVAEGERITITRHGHAVAVIAPVAPRSTMSRAEAIAAARELRQTVRATAAEIRAWTEEGRD